MTKSDFKSVSQHEKIHSEASPEHLRHAIGAIAIGAGRIHGGLRPRVHPGTDSGRADERAASGRMPQHLPRKSVGGGKEASAARLGDQGTATGRHSGGMAARPAGPQYERVLFQAVPDRGGGRAISQPDGELRLQQRHRKVRAGYPGPGGGTGTADHDRPNPRGHGSRQGARPADRRTDQVQRRQANQGARLAERRNASSRGGAAAQSVAGHDQHIPQARNAVAGPPVDKIYCAAIPFVSASQQHQAAIDAGIPEKAIYVQGRGAETFETCIAQFRGAGGMLGLVGGLRVLGGSRVGIVARVRFLKSVGITPYDFDTGETDETELLNAAIKKINGARSLRLDPRQPRRLGRRGGLAKGIAAQARRNAIMAEDIVQRLCEHPKLNWQDRAGILGLPWSESTLRRKYGQTT